MLVSLVLGGMRHDIAVPRVTAVPLYADPLETRLKMVVVTESDFRSRSDQPTMYCPPEVNSYIHVPFTLLTRRLLVCRTIFNVVTATTLE